MANDSNLEWLGHVQPVGLVVASSVLSENGLVPAEQTRIDTDEFRALLSEVGPALADPWQLAAEILGWPVSHVAGVPGGPALPEDELRVFVPEAETVLVPDWAIVKPGGGWQMLVQRLPMGVEPDRRGALSGWEATPHQRLERLLRETAVPAGLLLSDDSWRLIYAPRGETSGQITFPLQPMGTVAGRPMLGGLKLLLDRTRLFTDAPNKRLPAILAASREAQAAVSAALASQVLGALHELLRGLHAADPVRLDHLAEHQSETVYEGLLTVMLRLIFLLYAEDRDLIPSRADAAARALYHRSYGIRGLHARLRHDVARNPDTMNERYGAWGQLLATFRLVHAGDGSGWILSRGGNLFDPARFPFLQGQDSTTDPVTIPRISDGVILRVLDQLLMLKGERLSYRTLDVEQIGSVYETVMGFEVQPAPGPALAIRAGKNNRTPVFVDLAALVKLKGKDRVKALKEDYSRTQLSAAYTRAVEAAGSTAAMAEALRPIVDERGSPGSAIAPAGTPILQPTDERRRTGSHYTPRSLTEPIVRHALEPAFERIGAAATPDAVLALKVCDPAMGSGAFLVEACRQLATRLIAAWAWYPDLRPAIPADEDEDLLARRLVAQRCLYGVDRNPLAADLARLSLWLATLARDHEFTFLDHALKSGDSLVGLTAQQIGGLRWRDGQSDVAPFDGFLRDRVRQVTKGRSAIREAPDNTARAIQEQRHRQVENWTSEVRLLGDATLAAFFASDRSSAQESIRVNLGVSASLEPERSWPRIREAAAGLMAGEHPIRAFHWEIEFPEVFATGLAGFDAIVGNPPFLGGKRISTELGTRYANWLTTLHEGTYGNCDLVAHFFRSAFRLLRDGGCLGMISTNTIGQGDTRESGLRWLLANGAHILRARRRLTWPGEAAVVVSVVHLIRGPSNRPELDGRVVDRISAYLMSGSMDESPAQLHENDGQAHVGCYVLGMGFVFAENVANSNANTLLELQALRDADRTNPERIFPYVGGEALTAPPTERLSRYVIDFADFPLRRDAEIPSWMDLTELRRKELVRTGVVPIDYPYPTASDWPQLLKIIEDKVKPERAKLKRAQYRNRWWQFAEKQSTMRAALAASRICLAVPAAASTFHCILPFRPPYPIFSHKVIVICSDDMGTFGVLQSRSHEMWSAYFGATLGDAVTYNPTNVFATFPRPIEKVADLIELSVEYHQLRESMATDRFEGLTKIYNRFHDPAECAPDIQRLRDLHHEVDVAVLRAYGWDDLADAAAPEFLAEDTEPDHRYQGRLFWPASFRDGVLARLLTLNSERAAEELRAGLEPITLEHPDDMDQDA